MTRPRALCAALAAAAVCLSAAAQPPGGPTSVSAAADPGPTAVLKLPGPSGFDFSDDWYFEAVMRLDRRDGVSPVCFLPVMVRWLRGAFQVGYEPYRFNGPVVRELRWPDSAPHHVLALSAGGEVAVFVDGVLRRKSAIPQPFDAVSGEVTLHTRHEFRLLRFGKAADAATLPARHYNDGNPLAYDCPDGERAFEYRPDDAAAAAYGEDPYAPALAGDRPPPFAPRYVGQRYRDAAERRVYVANGNSAVGDWVALATAEDLASLPLKTVGGASLRGRGDVTVKAVPYRAVEDVTLYGAKGDGVADDTRAVLAAAAAAKVSGRPLYFPKGAAGIYRITRGIPVEGFTRVFGEGATVIRAPGPAFVVSTREAAVEGLVLACAGPAPAIDPGEAEILRIDAVAVRGHGGLLPVACKGAVWIDGTLSVSEGK